MKIQTLKVRNICIGEGIPKICVPVVATSRETILRYAEQALEEHPDMIEIRMDWFQGVSNTEVVKSLLQELRQIVGETILLFTIRTRKEGGELEISIEDYMDLCRVACESGWIDLLDIEAFMREDVLDNLAEVAHNNGVVVVASNHDFEHTPSKEEIVRRLEYMGIHGGDIPKIAVMPQSEEDVLTLLAATVEYYRRGNTKPVITMSMGGVGVISRLAGEFFGSAVTFASEGQISAPGQMSVSEAKQMLSVLHEYR